MVVSTSAKNPSTQKPNKANIRRTAVVVLGMHRSGTSALTRVLSLLGCDLPKTLLQASPNNQAGHWESEAIYKLNDRILNSAGSAWHDWTEFNPGWIDSPKAGQFKDEAIELIESEFGESGLFVFKDPRICRLLPFWRDVFENCEVRPLALLPIRNPLEVAASLEKRNGFEPALGHLLWLRHVLDAEAASRDMPRVFSTYDQLMQSWGRVAENAQNVLDIRWPRLSDTSSAEIDDFLVERLRHHQNSPESVVDNPGLSPWLRETYAIMQSWAETGEKPEDRPVLERIRGELNTAAPAFARLIAVGQSARQTAAELAAARGEIEQARKQQAESEKVIAGLKEHVDLLLSDVKASEERARAEKAELENRLRADEERARADVKASEERARAEKAELENRLRAEAEKQMRLAREIGRTMSALLDGNAWRFMPNRIRVLRKMALLKRSGLFDAEWYRSHYKDIAESGIDPLKHYVAHGAQEGREPNRTLAEVKNMATGS